MRTSGKKMTRREQELLKRCILLMAGTLFFFMLAAVRAHSGEYLPYPPDDNPWYFPDEEEEYDVMGASDHILAARMRRRLVGDTSRARMSKASRVNDSVTIIVKENTSSEITSSNDLKRDASNNMQLTNWITPSFSGGLGGKRHGEQVGGNTPTLAWNTSRAHKSDSTIERSQNLTSTLTGMVIDVRDNGYLVVEAKKSVNVNGEIQVMTVKGIVNPAHMDSKSTINAEYIMDMEVSYTGSGPMSRMDRRGWGAKALDFINPF